MTDTFKKLHHRIRLSFIPRDCRSDTGIVTPKNRNEFIEFCEKENALEGKGQEILDEWNRSKMIIRNGMPIPRVNGNIFIYYKELTSFLIFAEEHLGNKTNVA